MQTFTIIMLGSSGAGKTVYLASMHKYLSLVRSDTLFFVEAEASQRRLLNDKFAQIADPTQEWPDGTLETSEWNFTVKVKNSDGKIFSGLKFVYLDYAGRELSKTASEEGVLVGEDGSKLSFDRQLKEADILLGLLDGKRILSLMRGSDEEEAQRFLLRELPSILQVIQQSEQPIHFVISKWDLLREKYSLVEVVNFLRENSEDFDSIISNSNKKYLMRLIPISSVGFNFAELQADGEMKKKRGAIPKPFQVEAPLACVIPDVIRVLLERLEKRQVDIEEKIESIKPDDYKLSFWDLLGRNVGKGLKEIYRFIPPTFRPDQELFGVILEFVEYGVKVKQEESSQRAEMLKDKQRESLELVKDEKTALDHLLTSFFKITEELESKGESIKLTQEL